MCPGRVQPYTLLAAFTVLGVGAAALQAQTSTGRLVGTVKDATGAVIPGVEITVTQLGTAVQFTTATNQTGEYVAPLLKPGEYSVTARHPGFKSFTQSPVNVQVNQDAGVNMTLEVGSVTEKIEVTAQTSLVQTHTSTLSQVVTTQQVVDLPLNGRNFLQLGLLQPGVSETHPAGLGHKFRRRSE